MENFFYREYKKAKKDHYDADEFFQGCLNILDVFDQILQKQVNDQKNDIYQMIDWSNDSCLKNDNLSVGPKLVDPEHERIFSSFRDKLSIISKSDYSIHLPSITSGKYQGIVCEADISFLRGELKKAQKKISIEECLPLLNEEKELSLKIDQIALYHVYQGIQITRENGNEIAKQHGHNSGEKLFQRFSYFSSLANRKAKPVLCTPKKLDNKIKLIESIIELLPTEKQERAKDEVSILKKIYESEYQ